MADKPTPNGAPDEPPRPVADIDRIMPQLTDDAWLDLARTGRWPDLEEAWPEPPRPDDGTRRTR